MPKLLAQASMAIAGLVALASVLDMVLAVPFAGQMMLDIMLLVSAGIVAYLGWEALSELPR